MKNNRISKICFLCSVLLVIGFFLKVTRDYVVYTTTLNSAPFTIWMVVDALYFILPALLVMIVGIIGKKKNSESVWK